MPESPDDARISPDQARRFAEDPYVQGFIKKHVDDALALRDAADRFKRREKIRLLLSEVAQLMREDGQEPDFDHARRCDRCKNCPHRLKVTK